MENYKEKYERSVQAARYWHSNSEGDIPVVLEYIFPELASEDERIRIEIRDFICWATDRGSITSEQVEKSNSWLAWLEKQGKEAIGYIHTIDKDGNYTIEPILSNSSSIGKDKQKPAWSEEDERIKQDIKNLIHFALRDGSAVAPAADTTKEDAISWIQSLRDRVQPQPKQEWSKEDIEMLNSAISFVEHSAFTTIGKEKNNVISWLKSIKSRLQ